MMHSIVAWVVVPDHAIALITAALALGKLAYADVRPRVAAWVAARPRVAHAIQAVYRAMPDAVGVAESLWGVVTGKPFPAAALAGLARDASVFTINVDHTQALAALAELEAQIGRVAAAAKAIPASAGSIVVNVAGALAPTAPAKAGGAS